MLPINDLFNHHTLRCKLDVLSKGEEQKDLIKLYIGNIFSKYTN